MWGFLTELVKQNRFWSFLVLIAILVFVSIAVKNHWVNVAEVKKLIKDMTPKINLDL